MVLTVYLKLYENISLFQTPIEDSPDFAVLKFHAGPPYEVSMLTIVNWEE